MKIEIKGYQNGDVDWLFERVIAAAQYAGIGADVTKSIEPGGGGISGPVRRACSSMARKSTSMTSSTSSVSPACCRL